MRVHYPLFPVWFSFLTNFRSRILILSKIKEEMSNFVEWTGQNLSPSSQKDDMHAFHQNWISSVSKGQADFERAIWFGKTWQSSLFVSENNEMHTDKFTHSFRGGSNGPWQTYRPNRSQRKHPRGIKFIRIMIITSSFDSNFSILNNLDFWDRHSQK